MRGHAIIHALGQHRVLRVGSAKKTQSSLGHDDPGACLQLHSNDPKHMWRSRALSLSLSLPPSLDLSVSKARNLTIARGSSEHTDARTRAPPHTHTHNYTASANGDFKGGKKKNKIDRGFEAPTPRYHESPSRNGEPVPGSCPDMSGTHISVEVKLTPD